VPFKQFDRSQLKIKPLAEREHDLTIDVIMPLDAEVPPFGSEELAALADEIVTARAKGAPVILMMGAHVLRRGNARYIIDLMERGIITHIGMNGAGAIHDYEFARIGATTESVAKYISEGQFGLWKETGEINDIMVSAYQSGMGLGEAIGKHIEEHDFPYKATSVFAAGYRLQIPVTVHAAVGQDILHEHPNLNGAALGETSYRDFLIFAQTITGLQDGVYLNYGTAVMGPEVYLKALAMARNVAHQHGEMINRFTTAVFDLIDLGEMVQQEAAKTTPSYYFRPYKTILVRTVSDGGKSHYVRGDHGVTFPNLYRLIMEKQK
jgi:hypothetical protein